MKKETLRVLIVGQSKTGKTTVAHYIKDALKEAGFKDVTISDSPDSPDKEPITERMKKTIERPVSIEVYTIGRIPLEEAQFFSTLRVR